MKVLPEILPPISRSLTSFLRIKFLSDTRPSTFFISKIFHSIKLFGDILYIKKLVSTE